MGPSYVYYDYPYYYSRGHYPTHIGGYVYYALRNYYYPRFIIEVLDPLSRPERAGIGSGEVRRCQSEASLT